MIFVKILCFAGNRGVLQVIVDELEDIIRVVHHIREGISAVGKASIS